MVCQTVRGSVSVHFPVARRSQLTCMRIKQDVVFTEEDAMWQLVREPANVTRCENEVERGNVRAIELE